MSLSFDAFLELVERLEAAPLELPDPAVVDLVNRNRVEVVELLAPAPRRRDEARVFEHVEVLRHGLPRHVHPVAELGQRETVAREHAIEQLPPPRIRERFEDLVHAWARYASNDLHVNRDRSSA